VTKEEICMALTPALVSRAKDLKAFGTKIDEKSALSLAFAIAPQILVVTARCRLNEIVRQRKWAKKEQKRDGDEEDAMRFSEADERTKAGTEVAD
jgi:hypothetical protein